MPAYANGGRVFDHYQPGPPPVWLSYAFVVPLLGTYPFGLKTLITAGVALVITLFAMISRSTRANIIVLATLIASYVIDAV